LFNDFFFLLFAAMADHTIGMIIANTKPSPINDDAKSILLII